MLTFSAGTVRFDLRRNSWDERALGYDVYEIVNAQSADSTNEDLLEQLNKFLDEKMKFLAMARVCSSESRFLKALHEISGFRYVEASYQLRLTSLKAFEIPSKKIKNLIIRPIQEGDLEALQEIAAEAFSHGRFAEDPLIPTEIHQRRQQLWIKDLSERKTPITVLESGTDLLSFMAYNFSSPTSVELILGGSRPRGGLASVYFWNALLNQLFTQGVKRVSTTVSTANLGILNLYGSLGFRFHRHFIGLHKHHIPK